MGDIGRELDRERLAAKREWQTEAAVRALIKDFNENARAIPGIEQDKWGVLSIPLSELHGICDQNLI